MIHSLLPALTNTAKNRCKWADICLSMAMLFSLWAQGAWAANSVARMPESTGPQSKLKLHVPSPDWRDQVIYFLMTDRFNDGNPANNDQGAGEFDPANNDRYSGGDIAGVTAKLDYIRGLGATAVWLTPIVANQWWDPRAKAAGYHGYWAENFMAVDRHNGTLADYRQLSHQLHRRGMYLVQDIVVNHIGDFGYYEGGWDACDPAKYFALNEGSRPVKAPTQWPFSLNDARLPAHREAGIYHWTPVVADYTDENQRLNYQIAGGLDDLNTESPLVQNALRDSYAYWIKNVGVDAFRVDTALHVPAGFFRDFLYAKDRQHPGIFEVARQTGRRRFHVFGEAFAIDLPNRDRAAQQIESYIRTPDGTPLMPGMLNFPLYGSVGDVFARGRPTSEMGYRLKSMMTVHRQPHLMVNFVDNHDVDRFLAGGSEAALKQALLLLMTVPGIPAIYAGTEQGFTMQRAALFKAGYQSGGRDHFDTQSTMYRYIQSLTTLRKQHRLFSRGKPVILKENQAGPGALAYRMQHGREAAIVVFNTADADILVDHLDTGAAPGTVLKPLFALHTDAKDAVVGQEGQLSFRLPARSAVVWQITKQKKRLEKVANDLTLDALPANTLTGDFMVSGKAPSQSTLRLVVDGDLAHAQTVMADAKGHWRATVDTGRMIDAAVGHELVAWSEAGSVSGPQRFRVERQWQLLYDAPDPAGDDRGPQGKYAYPNDGDWNVHHQADIQHIQVWGAEGAMKVVLRMNQITTSWNPLNGFDHVAFTLFVELPDKPGGVRAMPLQNADLPGGMRWHYRLRAHGWTNALFSAEGASAQHEGKAVIPAADIAVDRANNTVSFVFSGAALGQIKSLHGVRLYVNTWDYDGGYRALLPNTNATSFGGGDGQVDALIMDDSGIITLP